MWTHFPAGKFRQVLTSKLLQRYVFQIIEPASSVFKFFPHLLNSALLIRKLRTCTISNFAKHINYTILVVLWLKPSFCIKTSVEWSSSFQLFISSHFPFTLQLYLNCGRIQVCSHWDSLVVLMLIMIDITEQMCFHICESISSLINW